MTMQCVAVKAAPTESVSEAAAQCIRHGFAVCRIRSGQKLPSEKGWTGKSARPEEFEPGDGIGAVCGWSSGDLVGVDLDSLEAVKLAAQFLPPTGAIEGRDGKPASHWLYRVVDIPDWAISRAKQAAAAAEAAGKHPGPFKKAFNHAVTSERVIDFQGTGGQIVLPPSVHDRTGEVRRWEAGCSIDQVATVRFIDLWDAVCKLAAACGAKIPRVGPNAPTKRGKAAKKAEQPVRPVALAGRAQGARTRYEGDVPMAERMRRCGLYLPNVELARSGHGGHDATYRAARIITNDFAIDDEEQAMELMRGYNRRLEDAGEEVWTEDQLRHKVVSAREASADPTHPPGCKLGGGAGGGGPRAGGAGAGGNGPWDDPSRLAEAFVTGCPVLLYSGRYFLFNGVHWNEVDAKTLQARVWTFIEAEARRCDPESPPKVKRALRDNVMAAIEARGVARLCGRECEVVFNAWLPGTGRAGDTLVVRNGLLDVATGELRPHTPDFLGLYCLPYDYDPSATCPTWERVVGRICDGDAELVLLLQQWFGYCLTRSTDLQRFMVLVGEGANGKSTLAYGLLAVVGQGNASHVPLEKFSGTFDLGYTLGKLVNTVDDMSEIDKAAEGILKSYTAGGAMGFNQKNRPILHARPTAKLMFCTNTVPRFSDRSNGVWRRLLLIPLAVVIPPSERVRGMDKPEYWDGIGETAGMLNWTLAGLRSLHERGFVLPACVRAAVDDHQVECNPTRQFLADHLEAAGGVWVESHVLYRAYALWMKENGHKAMSHTQLTRELRRFMPGVERSNRTIEGKAMKVLTNVRWTAEHVTWAAQPHESFRTLILV